MPPAFRQLFLGQLALLLSFLSASTHELEIFMQEDILSFHARPSCSVICLLPTPTYVRCMWTTDSGI